ncbi:MAG: aminotransferase class I/II-fold pyridoxal phosphate-dependent enzyme [Acidimicrobiales bacterium]
MSEGTYRPSGRRAADIAADVEAAVASGRAATGMVLPSVRSLASELGVATGTVAAAYRLLAERGIVEGNRRAGTRILGRPTHLSGRGGASVPDGVVDLASGNPDPALLAGLGSALAGVALATAAEQPVVYGGPMVSSALQTIAEEWFSADGISLGAVTVVGGAMRAVERALQSHVRPGMRVAVEDPGYPGLLDLVSILGLIADPVALDDEGLVPASLTSALDRGCQAVVLTPRAQNPTGAALSLRRAAEIAGLLEGRPGVMVVEAAHAGPVSGAAAVSVAGLLGSEDHRRSMVVRSCAKFLSPDLRIALVSGDPTTVEAVERREAVTSGWVSQILQGLVAEIWGDPVTTYALAEGAACYAERRSALVDALVGAGLSAHGVSGLNVWVPVADEGATVAGMLDRGWAVAPGSRFRVASRPGVRITIATLDATDAQMVATDLASCMGASGRTRSG